MTTLGQTLANRENAQLSTGPKTAEGKAVSAANAFKHGLRALVITAKAEDAAEYAEFAAAYQGELNPQTVAQLELAERLVGMVWKARRAELVETALWNSGGGTIEDMAVMLGTHRQELETIMRYGRQNARQLTAARAEYRQLQEEESRRQAGVERAAAVAAKEIQMQKQRKEEDLWAHTRAVLIADMAEGRVAEAAMKAGRSSAEAFAEGELEWQRVYGEDAIKSRKLLGRPVGKLMADSYYAEEAEKEKANGSAKMTAQASPAEGAEGAEGAGGAGGAEGAGVAEVVGAAGVAAGSTSGAVNRPAPAVRNSKYIPSSRG